MRISVFGLGYVGTISAVCLAKDGHDVFGVDIYQPKVEMINDGKSPIIESEIGDIINEVTGKGRLRATTSGHEAVSETVISLVCVGTPSQDNGNLDLSYVERVCGEIGTTLARKENYHVVVIRSTMLPGSTHEVVIPTLERTSGKKVDIDFGVCVNPEFLREGTAVYDFYHPPKTVIGTDDDRAANLVQTLYHQLPGPKIHTSIRVAEMVKYADNAWHAVKVCYANEIGNLCKEMQIDSHEVMDIFCQDTKLNLSPYYLKPGFAFGGSCLPKDVRALTYKGKMLDLELPLLNAVIPSNLHQIHRGIKRILLYNKKRIGVLGFSFKAGTDDLRESPILDVIETLLGKGCDIKIYDRAVNLARLVGTNREFIEQKIPHIAQLMANSVDEVLKHAELIIIGNKSDEFRSIGGLIGPGQHILDLVRLWDKRSFSLDGYYEGICW
jgi:GDP-mannose 6-dehydrogenase